MIQINDIYSLTDFQRNVKEHIKRLKASGRAQVLTINGRAEVVVQDADAYQKLLDLVERAEAIAGIRRGLDEMKAGKGRPAKGVLKQLRKKHHIPEKT